MLVWLLACIGTEKETGEEVSTVAICEETVELECEDAIIQDLALHDDKISDGAVSTNTDGSDFVSSVDASAGGYNDSANNPWVYVKFTADGLEKVEIDDETALDSMDWDMSLKRFMIRLNGGTSGGSCVGAVSLLEGDYSALNEIPEGLGYVVDEFYSSSCVIINDSSGLPGSPQLALAPWWSYDGCVKTTNVPHLIQLADGSVVKMVVESYYTSGQDACNAGTGSGEGSADYTLRWAYMD
jgi:hypothetical protein